MRNSLDESAKDIFYKKLGDHKRKISSTRHHHIDSCLGDIDSKKTIIEQRLNDSQLNGQRYQNKRYSFRAKNSKNEVSNTKKSSKLVIKKVESEMMFINKPVKVLQSPTDHINSENFESKTSQRNYLKNFKPLKSGRFKPKAGGISLN